MKMPRWVNSLLDAPAIPASRVPVKAKANDRMLAILNNTVRQNPYGASEDTVDTDAAYRMALVSAWVSSDIALIGNRITSEAAQLQVVKGRDKDAPVIDNHPFLALMDSPNSLMSGIFMQRYCNQWFQLRGNAFWFLATAAPGVGEIAEIMPLQANLVRPIPISLHEGRGLFRGRMTIDYEYNIGGNIITLPGENVVHFRTPNPFDFWEGLSPLTAAMLAIEIDHAQKVWQRDFFREENAIPSSIVSMPQEIGEHDFQRIVESVKAQLAEGMKRLFTRAGDLKVEVISQTLEQMQIIQSRQFSRDEIDRAFGIPDGVWSGNVSGDSRLAAEIALARNTIQPLLDYNAAQITADVLPYYGEGLVARAPNIVPQDRALEVQEYTIYSQDRTLHENRKARHEDALEMDSKLPSEVRDIVTALASVPSGLLQFVAPVVVESMKPEPKVPPVSILPQRTPNAEDEQDVGSMMGSQAPDQMAEDMAGKAADIAWRAESKQFRKWVRGRLPDVDVSAFKATVLSEADKTAIVAEMRKEDAPQPRRLTLAEALLSFDQNGTLDELDEVETML